ncbi:MAG: polysaccharide deacetylase family protein [Pirellulaceae bacterium]
MKPIASLSLDLDNKWSYMKTHGDPGWDSYPSYLDLVVPRFLEVLRELDLKITVFIVGQDAAQEKNHAALASITQAGHEVGNHSFHHEPWLHLYTPEEIERELSSSEETIERVTGSRPVGFRGPGYSFSPDVLRVLVSRGYLYDASTFPTFLGPIARAYYFFKSRLSREQKQERKQLFGKISEGFRPLKPYSWKTPEGPILEIPVTTMPVFRVPMHLSYILYLAQFSRALATTYFRFALLMCRLRGISPSLLLHPLDFLGGDDEPDLSFFPAMKMKGADKTRLVTEVLSIFSSQFRVVPMLEHARDFLGQPAPQPASRPQPTTV